MKQKTSITDIISKFRELHGDRYEYDISSYVNMKTPMTMICKNHGEFKRTPSDHTRLKHGCRKCGWEETGKAKRISWETFLEKSKTLHDNKYEYVQPEEFTGYDCLIEMKCPTHGTFKQKVKYHLMESGCPACGRMKCNIKVINRTGETAHGMYTLEEYLSTVPEEHRNKHDYSRVTYKGKNYDIEIGCLFHGTYFWQNPQKHRKGSGCPTCGTSRARPKILHEDFIARCKNKFGDLYNYDASEYIGSRSPFTYKCNTCQRTVTQSAGQHENIGNGCSFCKKSQEEREIEMFISNELSLDVIVNSRKILKDGKELDFYIPELHTAIEHHGTYYHAELGRNNKDKFYHLNKWIISDQQNIQLIQIFEDEWTFKKDICKSILRQRMNKPVNVFDSQKCRIENVSDEQAQNFLKATAIDNAISKNFGVRLGAFYENELVALITFNNMKSYWELSNFCLALNTEVVGIFDKLIQYFVEQNNPSKIITYVDRRWGNVNYTNFILVDSIMPSYYYMCRKNYLKREHKSNFTKDKIKLKFPDADLSKDEWTLMQENNYDRIWDCGYSIFEWKKENPVN